MALHELLRNSMGRAAFPAVSGPGLAVLFGEVVLDDADGVGPVE